MTGRVQLKKILLGILSTGISVVIIIISMAYDINFDNFTGYGYLGLFVGCIITNATLFLPTVSIALVIAASTYLSPFFSGLVAGLGVTLGESTGFFLARGCKNTFSQLSERKIFAKLNQLSEKRAGLVIFLFSLLPLPLFDIVGVLSGASNVSVPKFFTFCWLGKTIKMLAFAFLGVKGISIISDYIM